MSTLLRFTHETVGAVTVFGSDGLLLKDGCSLYLCIV